MKPQLIFGVLTIAIGLLGGSFTHPAIAFAERVLCTQRCCVRPWHLPRGHSALLRSPLASPKGRSADRTPHSSTINLPHSDRHCLH